MGNHPDQGSELASIFNCQRGTLPISYLGIPLSPYSPKRAEWDKVIHRINRKLKGWKSNLLSIGGRITLNLVLSAIPVYYLLLFRMLMTIIHMIDKAHINFLWIGPRRSQGRYHLAKWEMVCRPKSIGGFVNNSPQKWLWKFANGTPSLCVEVIQDHYFRRKISWTKRRAPSSFTSPN